MNQIITSLIVSSIIGMVSLAIFKRDVFNRLFNLILLILGAGLLITGIWSSALAVFYIKLIQGVSVETKASVTIVYDSLQIPLWWIAGLAVAALIIFALRFSDVTAKRPQDHDDAY